MAEDEKTGTDYIVLREMNADEIIAFSQGEVVFDDESRLFVTDAKPRLAPNGDVAIRTVAEESGVGGVYATVPLRSWDPAEWEIEQKPTARRVKTP